MALPKGKKRQNYGPEHYRSLSAAYGAYQKARLLDTPNPALAPRKKFATIWGWGKK